MVLQAGWQAGKLAGWQAGRLADSKTEGRQADRLTYIHTFKHTYINTYIHTDRVTVKLIDKKTRQTDRLTLIIQIDRQTGRQEDKKKAIYKPTTLLVLI